MFFVVVSADLLSLGKHLLRDIRADCLVYGQNTSDVIRYTCTGSRSAVHCTDVGFAARPENANSSKCRLPIHLNQYFISGSLICPMADDLLLINIPL